MRTAAAAFLLVLGCSGSTMQVVPSEGGQGGGETVRIEGGGFAGHGPPVVYVGQRAAKMVVVESDSLITITTPQTNEPRVVDVKIVYPDGTERTIAQAFEYKEQTGIILQPEIGG